MRKTTRNPMHCVSGTYKDATLSQDKSTVFYKGNIEVFACNAEILKLTMPSRKPVGMGSAEAFPGNAPVFFLFSQCPQARRPLFMPLAQLHSRIAPPRFPLTRQCPALAAGEEKRREMLRAACTSPGLLCLLLLYRLQLQRMLMPKRPLVGRPVLLSSTLC